MTKPQLSTSSEALIAALDKIIEARLAIPEADLNELLRLHVREVPTDDAPASPAFGENELKLLFVELMRIQKADA